jgi:hypothetical protein
MLLLSSVPAVPKEKSTVAVVFPADTAEIDGAVGSFIGLAVVVDEELVNPRVPEPRIATL